MSKYEIISDTSIGETSISDTPIIKSLKICEKNEIEKLKTQTYVGTSVDDLYDTLIRKCPSYNIHMVEKNALTTDIYCPTRLLIRYDNDSRLITSEPRVG
jgi:hypothetical protein